MSKAKPRRGPRKIGYARVSTEDQNLAVQIEALKNYGVDDGSIYVEKISAVAARRPAFKWALTVLRPGDEFCVHALDRLGRDLVELINSLQTIREAGATFKSLTQPELNDGTAFGRLMLFFQGAIAQYEREKVVERTRRGVETAKRAGQKFGVDPKLNHEQRAQCREWAAKGWTNDEIRREVVKRKWCKSISYPTMHNYLKRDE